jgi:hypothetical protein
VTKDADPRAGAGDYAWAAVVVAVVAGFLLGFANVLWDLANDRSRSQVLWVPLGLVSAFWLARLAWRRTVWGRPAAD